MSLMCHIRILSTKRWFFGHGEMPRWRKSKLKLCARNLVVNTLQQKIWPTTIKKEEIYWAMGTIPMSSTKVERSFSETNTIVTKKRTNEPVEHVSDLMTIILYTNYTSYVETGLVRIFWSDSRKRNLPDLEFI